MKASAGTFHGQSMRQAVAPAVLRRPASVWLQSTSQLTAELIAAWLDLHSKPCQSDAVPMSQEASSLEIEHAVMAIWMHDMPFCVRHNATW